MQLLNTLYITTPETRLQLDNDTLRVELHKETRLRIPLHHLQSVVCFGHVSVTLPLMHGLADRGITLVLMTVNGRFKARLEGPVSGNVLLRQAQHRIVNEPDSTLQIACAIVAGKLKNQRSVVLRGARDTKQVGDSEALGRIADSLAASLRRLQSADSLDVVRGIEGEGARNYFGALNLLVRPEMRPLFEMDGRTRRPPRDRLNALLSFLYSMWTNDCRSACEAVGLDPQLGFLHAVRPGKAALALDLVEEFRPWADRLALSLVNRGQLAESDFEPCEGGGVLLREGGRKATVVAFQERKQDALTHPLLSEAIPLGLVPLVQARLLAKRIRGDADVYLPFLPK